MSLDPPSSPPLHPPPTHNVPFHDAPLDEKIARIVQPTAGCYRKSVVPFDNCPQFPPTEKCLTSLLARSSLASPLGYARIVQVSFLSDRLASTVKAVKYPAWALRSS